MKYRCKWCHKEIEIPQSERAKTGLKMLEDHETECFKELHPEFGGYVRSSQKPTTGPEVPGKFDMEGIIGYLHQCFGRIPTEDEALRFHVFLNSSQYAPSKSECEDFVKLMGALKRSQ
jgi:hypothetical protein